jgi:hypothetical protein
MAKSEIENYIELNNHKDLGLVVTPPKTAEYIISQLGPVKKNEIVLDPCVGPGIFVNELLKANVRKEQIQTFDINPKYKEIMKSLGISFKNLDYLLDYTPLLNNQYDIILGNPPYLNKASSYIRKNKKRLHKMFGKINGHETYSMFIVSSIWRLKNGGRLGFITSDSFLTLRTHTKLRRFILNTCKINEILLPPKNLFDNQNVSTSPVIIILTKCSGKENRVNREKNIMRIIPRLENEDEYWKPKLIHEFEQSNYNLLPFNLFFINVEKEIIDLFKNSSKLEEYIKGNIGMHTHNNLKYIAAVEGTKLAELFNKRNNKTSDPNKKHKIITEKELHTDKWKPYLKRGGADQYYRPIMEALDWDPKSTPIYDIPKNVPFEEEGIVISGVSSRLAVRYMPEGCYWDSNKAIGFIIKDKSISIEYTLGLLNSSLYNYLAKGIINNTNSIQITGIHALPFILPDEEIKEKIENLVKKIVNKKQDKQDCEINKEQQRIDSLIFSFYANKFNFSDQLKNKLDQEYSIYRDG